MSPSTDLNSKKIKIYITTFPGIASKCIKTRDKETTPKMCDKSCRTGHNDRKFICTLCLNEQLESVNKVKTRLKNNTCPFCHQESQTCIRDASTDTNGKLTNDRNDCYISDVKCFTSITKGTVTDTEVENNNTEKMLINRNGGINKLMKQKNENISLPAECCRKHEIVREISPKAGKNTTDKICEGTEMIISIEDLINYKYRNNEKSTKPCIETICKAAGSGKIMKDNVVKENNISNKIEKNDSEERKGIETQTSKHPLDINTGLTLLNEVLTVFQNQKHSFNCKDASVQVTDTINKKMKSLSMSKLVNYSILDKEVSREHSKFIILECRQPDGCNRSRTSLHLTKHKSSSIPQMKLEELKYAIKEKNKSKDTVDEVNRMFAIVGKYDKESKDDLNRPLVRSGPRILPVVKTSMNQSKNTKEVKERTSESSTKNCHLREIKCCQTNEFLMSSGDSKECCSKCVEENKVDKCVYMLSCRHNVGSKHCECCKKRKHGCRCSLEHCVKIEDSDSSTNF